MMLIETSFVHQHWWMFDLCLMSNWRPLWSGFDVLLTYLWRTFDECLMTYDQLLINFEWLCYSALLRHYNTIIQKYHKNVLSLYELMRIFHGSV